MISKHFAHDLSSCAGNVPKLFKWNFNNKSSNVSVYIDADFLLAIDDINNEDQKAKFLWLLESPEFNGGAFDFVINNISLIEEYFEGVFTYSDEIAKLSNKIHKIWTTNTWIKNPKIHPKTKLVSMITSNKIFTPQQLERVNFARNNADKIDVFGRGFNELATKEQGLNDYMFSVCIENVNYDTYFTEKILDCFATGTIPIYKGTRMIADHFDENGIIFLDDLKGFNELTPELYFSKKESVERNFQTLQMYPLVDDLIFRDYLSKHI